MNNEELKKYIIQANQTIRQAMEMISENQHGLVVVENADEQIVGLVTDGDIRRGLLHDLTLDSPVGETITGNYIAVGPDAERAAVLDIMKARGIHHIPVVDLQKRLLGIHFHQDLISRSLKPNVAVIMAGGKGTRLMPLTRDCPKPMIKVAGRPILERLILHLIGFGIRKIYISINYQGEMIEEYFGDGTKFGCSIDYLKEKDALGTGGALSLLPEIPGDPLIVMNGDLVTQVNINRLLEFHAQVGAEATIAGRTHQIELPYGVIETVAGKLVQLWEKPSMRYLINTGIYVLNPEVLSLVPKNKSLPITRLFNVLLEKKVCVGVYELDEEWIDVGSHAELQRANGMIDD